MESFDYGQVQTKLEALGGVFSNFMTKLDTINSTLNDNVNVGDAGAFQGVVAKALLESWNNCSDRFVTFKEEFDILLNSVMQVSSNNASLEDEVIAMYGGGGGGSDGQAAGAGGASRSVASYAKM